MSNSDASDGAPAIIQASNPSYTASIYPGATDTIPSEFAELVKKLETSMAMPVWLLVQNGHSDSPYEETPFETLDRFVSVGFQYKANEITPGKPHAMLIHSPGGDAHEAFRIARMFQRRASRFTAIVPMYAKSAATLLALGANELIMGVDAEFGPLDVQVMDEEREEVGSALNAVQSLERLNAFGMTAVDQLMLLLVGRTGKKTASLLPHAVEYASSLLRPLLEKIDALDYTGKSRELRVAEEYAVRLMKDNYSWGHAKTIASALVQDYQTHGFIIDSHEAAAHEHHGRPGEAEVFGLGLRVVDTTPEIEATLSEMAPFLNIVTAIGRVQEVKS